MSHLDFHYAIWSWGQSNATGQALIPPNSAPSGLPIASIGWTPVVAPVGSSQGINTVSTLIPLDVTTPTLGGQPLYWGSEIQLGKDLIALNASVSILKTSRNGSSLASWLQTGGSNWVILNSALPTFKTNVIAAAGSKPIKWFMLTNQGEFEAQEVSSAAASAWAANLAQLKIDAETLMGVTFESPIVLRLNSNFLVSSPPPWLNIVRAQQAIADPSFINSDSIPLGPDETHYITPSSLALIGSAQALRVIPRNFISSQRLTVR